jgi:hypothetical protein
VFVSIFFYEILYFVSLIGSFSNEVRRTSFFYCLNKYTVLLRYRHTLDQPFQHSAVIIPYNSPCDTYISVPSNMKLTSTSDRTYYCYPTIALPLGPPPSPPPGPGGGGLGN